MKLEGKVFRGLLLAACALSMTAVSQASAHEFTASQNNVVITGEQHVNHEVISIGSAEVTCKQVKFEGTEVGNKWDQITLVKTASECTFEPFGAATVKSNHCASVFDSDTDEFGHAAVLIECTGTDTTEIVAPGCTVKIGAQEKRGISYTNVKTGLKKEITAHTTVKGLAYTKSGFSCFLISGEAQINGTLTFKGYVDEGSLQSGTDRTTPVLNEGDVIDLTVE